MIFHAIVALVMLRWPPRESDPAWLYAAWGVLLGLNFGILLQCVYERSWWW